MVQLPNIWRSGSICSSSNTARLTASRLLQPRTQHEAISCISLVQFAWQRCQPCTSPSSADGGWYALSGNKTLRSACRAVSSFVIFLLHLDCLQTRTSSPISTTNSINFITYQYLPCRPESSKHVGCGCLQLIHALEKEFVVYKLSIDHIDGSRQPPQTTLVAIPCHLVCLPAAWFLFYTFRRHTLPSDVVNLWWHTYSRNEQEEREKRGLRRSITRWEEGWTICRTRRIKKNSIIVFLCSFPLYLFFSLHSMCYHRHPKKIFSRKIQNTDDSTGHSHISTISITCSASDHDFCIKQPHYLIGTNPYHSSTQTTISSIAFQTLWPHPIGPSYHSSRTINTAPSLQLRRTCPLETPCTPLIVNTLPPPFIQ